MVLLWYDICQTQIAYSDLGKWNEAEQLEVQVMGMRKKLLGLAKAVQHCAIPGLYSGIFVIYLQHRGSPKSTDRAKNVLFYALLVLYALTTAIIIVDMLVVFCHCLTLFQLILQNVEILYHLEIIQGTLFAFCDVIAQSILVCTTLN